MNKLILAAVLTIPLVLSSCAVTPVTPVPYSYYDPYYGPYYGPYEFVGPTIWIGPRWHHR